MTAIEPKETRPQPGPQDAFLKCSADIAFYGGAAGGGKSFALLLEPLRHFDNGRFGCVIFRRTVPEIRNEGGLWDDALNLYVPLGAWPKESTLEMEFKSGMRVKFSGLEYEKDVYNWHGSQVPFFGFDELTLFTERQFFYLLSRNRSNSGVSGYIRATMNADSRSWVKNFIQWWIDEETGFPIPERSGVVRYFIRVNDRIIWADTKEKLIREYNVAEADPMSFTFIASSVFDNKILLEKNPRYLASLR